MDNLVCNAVAPWKGYLHWVGNIREGKTNSGDDYAFADFTLKYTDHRMQEKYITFSTSGTESVDYLKNLALGTPLKVLWQPTTKEDTQRNRWYSSLNAYSISAIREEKPQLGQQQPQAQQPRQSAPAPQNQPYDFRNDGLPF